MEIQVEKVKVVVFPDGRLDTENAARFLGLSPKTLAIMRSRACWDSGFSSCSGCDSSSGWSDS